MFEENSLGQVIQFLQALPTNDPLVYIALLSKLADNPQLAYEASELLQAHRGSALTSSFDQSTNIKALSLQSAMQYENRAYTAISNILKSRHDTLKNSVGNIR
jgi:hypothetical protein